MFRYTARIICDKCGIALIDESGSKKDVASVSFMIKRAKRNGWAIKNKGVICLCEHCKNNAKRSDK